MKKQRLLILAMVIYFCVCLFTACNNTSNSGGGNPNNSDDTAPVCTHPSTEWKTDKEATCTEAGSSCKDCTVCHETIETKVIPATGHCWIWVVDKYPTATETGLKHEECSVCHAKQNENIVIDAGVYADGLAYSVNDDGETCTITGIGICTQTALKIPEEIDGYTVTSIDDDAFYDCYSLTSIVIPDNVTTIGENAFYDCYSLTSVTIGDSVTIIGERAFYCCDRLPSVTIGNNVTTIGSGAFYGCDSLTDVYYTGDIAGWCGISFGSAYSNPMYYADNLYFDGKLVEGELVIPDGVKIIPTYAFKGQKITKVIVGGSVTTIGDKAFYDCDSLTSIVIPDSVTTIGDGAFYACGKLTSVTIPDSVTTIGSYAFEYCSSLTSIVIPDSVTTIGSYAFYSCDSLTSVTIGDSVTTIGDQAFSFCTSLTSVTIGNSVTTIGDYAFYSCDSLKSITIPDSVTTIGDDAFNDCDSLTSVTIGNSVTTIGERAFYGCTNLTSITVDENNHNYKSIDGNLYSKDGKTLIQYAIGKTATSFVIPDSVTTIGEHAFRYCDSLTSVTIPDGVTTIGSYAFYGCTSLTSATIGNSVTTIGEGAFGYCTSLTDVYYTGTEEQWNAISIDSNNTGLTDATRYYFSNCIHSSNQWRYDSDGNISTELTIGDWIVDVEATCTTNGSKHAICNICGGTITVEIPTVEHIRGEDGECVFCGEEVPPYIITNDATYAFVENDGVLQSTNEANSSSSSYVITAYTTITITFDYNVSSESNYDNFYIYHNDTQKVVKSGTENSYTSYSITINAGDTLTFMYTKDYSSYSGDDCCYIKNLTITTVNN